MNRNRAIAAAASLAVAGTVSANPNLLFDVNHFHAQSFNSAGVPSAFTGLFHTGSIHFSIGQGYLNDILIQTIPGGSYVSAGFSGFALTTLDGQINLVNGQVTGGNIVIGLNNSDQYICDITPNTGSVRYGVGGSGFAIESHASNGFFSDAQFGNVNVVPWFNAQGPSGLSSWSQLFIFNPNLQGSANPDIDLIVDAAPLPLAAWTGLATIAGIMVVRRSRT